MGQLNINRNIFLEKEELTRFQSFLVNNTVSQIFLGNTSNFGIVRTDFVSAVAPDFLVEVGTNVGTIKIAQDSKAVDSDGLMILQEAINNVSVPNDGSYYWVKISHIYRRAEVGEVSVNVNGEVSGIGTSFLDVLRGQQTNVPTKVKFVKTDGNAPNNDQTYDVVDVTDDLNCILNGDFVAESGLKIIVLGSTEFGEALTASQLEGLYKYDSCNLEFILETVLDTAPTVDFVAGKDFYIARVVNNGGTVTVEDKRDGFYWLFNIEGIDGKMDKTSNLSDIGNVATARNNLNVYSKQEVDNLLLVDNTGYVSMTNGVAASSSNFDISICRIGKTVNIQGQFVGGGNTSPNAIVAQILLAQIGGSTAAPPRRVYINTSNEISSKETNRGISMYIDPFQAGDTQLLIKVLREHDANNGTFEFNITYITN